MNKILEIFVTVLTAISVGVILVDYAYNLTENQRLVIYIFDSGVVIILATDFYKRMKSSNDTTTKFILKHWYEIPAMLPVFVFDIIGTQAALGAAVRSIRLIRLFRLIHIFFRTTAIFRESRFLYLITFSLEQYSLGQLQSILLNHHLKMPR